MKLSSKRDVPRVPHHYRSRFVHALLLTPSWRSSVAVPYWLVGSHPPATSSPHPWSWHKPESWVIQHTWRQCPSHKNSWPTSMSEAEDGAALQSLFFVKRLSWNESPQVIIDNQRVVPTAHRSRSISRAEETAARIVTCYNGMTKCHPNTTQPLPSWDNSTHVK
jgi:hypothetical protein